MAGGAFHTCAVTAAGGALCWGDNGISQLGAVTTQTCSETANSPCSTTPVQVIGLTTGVAAIAAGNGHTCSVTTTGRPQCWGGNGSGRLGDGTTVDRTEPVDVVGLTVGGVAELPEVAGTPLEAHESSASSTGLLASLAAAVASGTFALGGAAWYARRRWLR